MKYLVLMADRGGWDEATDAQRQAVLDAHTAFHKAVAERASMVAGEALAKASEAVTLRPLAGGDRGVTEGPFAETAEQLGGFYLLEAPDRDTVVELCGLLPDGYTIEIRPVIDVAGYDDTREW